jgi:hypothetical protein
MLSHANDFAFASQVGWMLRFVMVGILDLAHIELSYLSMARNSLSLHVLADQDLAESGPGMSRNTYDSRNPPQHNLMY